MPTHVKINQSISSPFNQSIVAPFANQLGMPEHGSIGMFTQSIRQILL
jgi:hypothetical protein